MSIAAERVGRPDLPREWERLERRAEQVAGVVAYWKRRALEAEGEVARLRASLEALAAAPEAAAAADLEAELRRLRAENAALASRMTQARQRVGALLKRLAALGLEP